MQDDRAGYLSAALLDLPDVVFPQTEFPENLFPTPKFETPMIRMIHHSWAMVGILLFHGFSFLIPAWSYPPPASAGEKRPFLSLEAGSGPQQGITIRGNAEQRQLLVTGRNPSGREIDETRHVRYSVVPDGVVEVDPRGLITPRKNGSAVITATTPDGTSGRLPVSVIGFESNPPVNFSNDVVPLFTKYGCNGGGCHGAAAGQHGFKLSLLGFEPAEDLEHLVSESRGRRISIDAPAESLLLKKATGSLAHGGGARIDREAPEYQVLLRWIAEGAQPGRPEAPKIARLDVFPKSRLLAPESDQQLLVMAIDTDGTKTDVTSIAIYEANTPQMATVSSRGLVTTTRETGDVGIMVRYQSQVAVFRATVPLGRPIPKLPPARNFIDELVFQKLTLLGMPPSPVCDDETFLRRVTLDIAGRLPRPEEVNSFLADPAPGRRDTLIDRLLNSGDYASYFAQKWSVLLKNQRDEHQMDQTRPGTYLFHRWLQQAFQENRPYDVLVHQILTASGEVSENPPVVWYRHERDLTTQVEDVAQLFLGQRIQCARCHHHPFERWSETDYYRLAAFFSRVGRKSGVIKSEERIFHNPGQAQAAHPRTGEKLAPAGLGIVPLHLTPEQDPRVELARWIISPENPFFARALVNRYWKHFFGRGLVEPEDDLRATNPPVNPELMEALAAHLIASHFDLKQLIRTICQSTTYQLSSDPITDNQNDSQNFSRFYPRRLSAEVLLDAVDIVTGSKSRFPGMPATMRAVELPDSQFPSYFLTVFGRPRGETVCECERSSESNLAQSLHLINSPELAGKISFETGTVNHLVSDQRNSIEEKIRALYLLTYSRSPRPEELQVIIRYLQAKSLPDGSENRQAYEDVLWSLINTKEFLFNH